MNKFEYKSFFELKKMPLAAVKKYHLEKRKYEYENGIEEKGISFKKAIHIFPYLAVALDRKLSKNKLIKLSDKREKSDKPIIYACAHCHPEDPATALEAIKEHAYLFLGDPEDVYQRFEGLLLELNGVVNVETRPKQNYIDELIKMGLLKEEETEEFTKTIKFDRKIAYAKSVEILKKGANLLIFPEGAVNLTTNLPVMGLYPGAVKMALETGAEIVPMALERYGNRFYVNIGSNIKVTDRGATSIQYYNEKLRDEMATLKWQIWDYQGIKKREECPTKEEFINQIMSTSDFIYSEEDIYETMYHDKNITRPEDVKGLYLRHTR
jgi:1-acyl-sn-glycerol-3-phosphate acyltransferase